MEDGSWKYNAVQTKYAWFDYATQTYKFIMDTELQVKMCSEDWFKKAIENKEGCIIPVQVSTTITQPERIYLNSKNWEEDYVHHGKYENNCVECKEKFFGSKNRYICKQCKKDK